MLSWSPEFCHSHPSAEQCSKHIGFIVHGLWPQNNNGTWPENCPTNQSPPTSVSPVADIMPQEIVAHEWQAHGTCSGLGGDAYLALIRRVHDSIRIPSDLQNPTGNTTAHPTDLKRDFEQANPGLTDNEIAVQLHAGYLNAVEFCLSKSSSPAPVACSGVRDASRSTFRVPRVR